jgi:hypothetical protein
MWLVWLGTLVLVRYGAHAAFHRFSYHRGIWHSILAAVFFWFLTAAVYYRMMGYNEGVSWLAGGFLFMGYMTHLVLDEIYSVDVLDTRLKRSFGTALKFIDRDHWSDTAAVLIATILVFALTPSPKPFVEGISSRDMWAGLQQRLLPQDRWFGILGDPRKATASATAAGDASTITTGSVPPTTETPRNP